VTKTYKEPGKKDREYEVNALWTFCSISGKQLVKPIVSCELGRLYNKDAILHFLLDRGKQPEETQRRLAHIKRMKDVVELKLSSNPAHRIDKSGKKHGAEYHCPISTLEMNGRHKFGFILQTGTALSERAIKQLAKSSNDGAIIDPHNDQKYDLDDIIYMNVGFTLEDEAEFETMKTKLRKRREMKKLAKAEKRKGDVAVDGDKITKKKQKRPLIVQQRIDTNTINSKLNTITATSIKQGREEVKQQKKKSEILSSLFTSHKTFIGDVDAETLNGRTKNLQTGKVQKVKGNIRDDQTKKVQLKLHTFRYKAGGLDN